MMQCRMCSQRMTRAGRLCRECECELERARHAGLAAGVSVPAVLPDAPARAGWPAMLRAPGAIIGVAFAVGVAGAVALNLPDASHARVASQSVMPGVAPPAGVDAGSLVASQVAPAARAEVRVTTYVQPTVAKPTSVESSRAAAPNPPPETPKVASRAPAPREHAMPDDPARALDAALSRCGHESFFARPGCEERARARYCADATASPQCAVPVRDYGQ